MSPQETGMPGPDLAARVSGLMGVPFPGDGPPPPRYGSRVELPSERPLMLYPPAVDELTPTALGVWAKIALRRQRGHGSTMDDVVVDLDGDYTAAEEAVQALYEVGALITPREAATRAAEAEEEAQRRRVEDRAERERRRITEAPDPWPAYGTEYRGTREDFDAGRAGLNRVLGVYQLFDDAGTLLYVGMSRAVGHRLQGRYLKPWTRYLVREAASVQDALWLEAGEIRWGSLTLNLDRRCQGRVALVPARRPQGGAQ